MTKGRGPADTPEIVEIVDLGGIRTNYHDLGRGDGNPLLFIHGSGPGVTAWANWRGVFAEMEGAFRVIGHDQLGFGYTEDTRNVSAAYGLDDWAAHLIALIDHLGIDQVDLVGNSHGGGVALATAVRYPERVGKIVCMGSVGVHFELTEALDFGWGYTPSIENMRKMMDNFVHDKSIITEDLVQMRYQASLRPGVQERYAALFPAPRQQQIERLSTPVEQLKAMPHQVLLIHGRDDVILPYHCSVDLHQLIQHSELHLFGDCGHWTQIEQQDKFIALIGDFFRS